MSLIGELMAAGVSEFVVCGGARNAPLVRSVVAAQEEIEDVRVWTQFDERSAGFFALGRVMATARPVAVIVTSGTAVGELLPSVMEAHYQGKPLILVTADRPERFRGTGAPQAVEQEGIFGVYADVCALGEWTGARPLHLNICLEEDAPVELRFPDIGYFAGDTSGFSAGPLAQFLRSDIYRGLVILVGGLDFTERQDVYYFCKELGVPVIADAASGLRELLDPQTLVDGDALLKELPPGKVLRLGDVPVGRFWRDLENLPDVEVISITRTGFAGLARESVVLTGPVGRVVKGMGDVDSVGDVLDHFRADNKRRPAVEELLGAYPESEPGLVRTLSVMATTGSSVFLGNSLPVREWNEFAQRVAPYDEVRAMRGANGIDGQISCWLAASADEEESWAVIGDLTALYDVQGLAFSRQVTGKKVLVVINNSGGRIFARLPRLKDMTESEQKAVIQEQEVDLAGLAALWKLPFTRVQSTGDFDQLDELTEGVTVVEVVPDKAETEAFWAALGQLREGRS